MKAIIPAAGYGTRMKLLPGQSKEMLVDEKYNYWRIIDYSLKLCKRYNLSPLVITRKDKKDLVEFLDKSQTPYMLYEPKEGEEWNNTVLASKPYWLENNLLLLPDVRFKDEDKIQTIEQMLKTGNNAVMALHEVTDPSNWGVVTDDFTTLKEKPKDLNGKHYAWGLIGFKDTYGQELFSGVESKILENVGFTHLEFFEDVTRGNK